MTPSAATIEHGALRSRRVHELRARVDRGEYRVDPDGVATAICRRLAERRGLDGLAAGPWQQRRRAA